jgi:hypothetical protein
MLLLFQHQSHTQQPSLVLEHLVKVLLPLQLA